METITPVAPAKSGGAAIVYLGGLRWLSAGGYNLDTNAILNAAWIVDGNVNGGQGAYIATGALPFASVNAASLRLLDGRVLVTGGFSTVTNFVATASCAVFDAAANGGVGAFSPLTTPMSSPRSNHTATLLSDGRVLVTGGQTADGSGHAVATADLIY